MTDFVPEDEQCLNELMKALEHARAAARLLESTPDADGLSKNAIEAAARRLSIELDALISRLDGMPTRGPSGP